MKNRIKFDLCVAACAAALVGFSAFGELTPKSWNGGASGDWGVAANWEPAGVPKAGNDVTIPAGLSITVDFETEQDGCVTVRDRDTMQQERIAIDALSAYLAEKVAF